MSSSAACSISSNNQGNWPLSAAARGALLACAFVNGVVAGAAFHMATRASLPTGRRIAYAVLGAVCLIPIFGAPFALCWPSPRKPVPHPYAQYRVADPITTDATELREGVGSALRDLRDAVGSDALEEVAEAPLEDLCEEVACAGTCAGQTLALHERFVLGADRLSSRKLMGRLRRRRVGYYQFVHKMACKARGCSGLDSDVRAAIESLEQEHLEGAATCLISWPTEPSELRARVENLAKDSQSAAGHIFLEPVEGKGLNAHMIWFQWSPILRFYDSQEGGLLAFSPGEEKRFSRALWASVVRIEESGLDIKCLIVCVLQLPYA